MRLDLGKINIKRFADGAVCVQLQESATDCDVFLVQPTCPPTNDNLMELLITIDACRKASTRAVTAVIPYFGYARADKKTEGCDPIAAKLVANLISAAGANCVIGCDFHSGHAIGFFDIPVEHVYGQPVILDYLANKISLKDMVIVSAHMGGVPCASSFVSNAPLAIVDKRFSGVMHLIGDVKGKVAILVNDMIDTVGYALDW